MNKEDLKKELERKGSNIKLIPSVIGLLGLLSVPLSILVWIWKDGVLAGKVCLTGAVLFVLMVFVVNMLDGIIKESINEKLNEYSDNKPSKSKFEEKIEQLKNEK